MSNTVITRIKEKRRAKARQALWSKAENAWRAEIEKLRVELLEADRREAAAYFRIKDLEAILRKIAEYGPNLTHEWANDVRHIARRALEEEW